ncbi:MAG TPA: acetate/propionate family kinase [Candidatus Dormibacteraeota bacterium]|nr:acetate/propionate family kinase [Candidatus Dormibacteraeota bacterium]
MRALVVNAGSSSVKLRLLGDGDELLATRDLEPGAPDAAVAALTELGAHADAVGHRVVHGGERFVEAVRVDGGVLGAVRRLGVLAPLHQPLAVTLAASAMRVLPTVPSIACFDTAFHATLPPAARTYALPREWRDGLGIRRYGFHGLSHAHVARRTAALVGAAACSRLVSCHLGAGASLAAVRDGASVDTTMGFTPLEGLVMATRSGTVDPGALLWLTVHAGLPAAEVLDALERRSGLAGLCGTGDLREVRRRAAAGDEDAMLALEVHALKLVQGIAAMVASLGGVDAVAFTGGAGEHDTALRSDVARRLAHLGIAVDEDRNAATGDREIGVEGAGVRAVVVEAREDLEIARQVRAVLGAAIAPAPPPA